MKKEPQKKIPTSKVKRASKILGTGAKVGVNYVKHYTKKLVDPSLSKEDLHQANASDIYDTLSELKGSALKVAQMMSMDEQVLPKAYQEKFALAQYQAPALSYPLIIKTFKKHFDVAPNELFDSFSKEAVHAASIGQVHLAEKNGQKLAVKIQYPGVADSISSDLKLVKPLAGRLFNMNTRDLNHYLEEVESKLIEETDYLLELERGTLIGDKSQSLNGLVFPKYYKEMSSKQVLTMDWIDGVPFGDFCKSEKEDKTRNEVGQNLWDFFLFQMKHLRLVHADPHPGNFLITKDKKIGVLDFGCAKEISEHFASNYFELLRPSTLDDQEKLNTIYQEIQFFRKEDTEEDKKKLREIYHESLALLAKPFHQEQFDFGDPAFFNAIFKMGENLSKDKSIRKLNNARGSRDALYVMRTFFGLYNLLHQLKAKVSLNYALYD